MRKILVVSVAALALAGCADGRGGVDWGKTLLLAVGTGGAAAVGTAVATDINHRNSYGYGAYETPRYGYGSHGHGHRLPPVAGGGYGYGRQSHGGYNHLGGGWHGGQGAPPVHLRHRPYGCGDPWCHNRQRRWW